MSRFHAVWLRYHCKCTQCIQAHSGQRVLDITSINADTTLVDAYIDGTFTILRY